MSEHFTYAACARVTRVEVIGDDGRLFTGYFEPGATLCIQDDGRTLKVFVGEQRDWREVITDE